MYKLQLFGKFGIDPTRKGINTPQGSVVKLLTELYRQS